MAEIPGEVLEIAKFLSFFAEARMYKPIDELAKPFSYEDVVRALEDALRQANVLLASAYEKKVNDKVVRVVRLRQDQEVPAPYIPKLETVKKFLELCKENLVYAQEAATLALTYRPKI
ncbi:MAG: hypothetical protein B6U76_09235 [Desulfurococcales archaeon ex4484_217_2]|nr:MAG: hypothetical protein B6U76_09235 [Desulfurococcales archaeon ex4484_217_2]